MYCDLHKTDEMKPCKSNTAICQHSSCNVKGSYKYPHWSGRYCARHKTNDMTHPHDCTHPGCTTKGSMKCEETGKRFCAQHRPDKVIRFKHSTQCVHPECKRRGNYIKAEVPKEFYCFEHRTDTMIRVYRNCLTDGCHLSAIYGHPEERKPISCVSHSTEGMVNLFARKCAYEICNKIPSYGLPNTRKRIFCAEHAPDGYIQLNTRKCIIDNCQMIASYKEGLRKKLTHCSQHAPEGFIRHKSTYCAQEGCRKGKLFGYAHDKKTLYCGDHAKEGMVNLYHKDCLVSGCLKTPSFGYPNGDHKITYCFTHRLEGMINLSVKLCRANDEPYNIPCPIIGNRSYDRFCTSCFAHLFPDNPKTLTIKKKTKEITVVSAVMNEFKEFIHDKPLYYNSKECDCTHRRRIDLRTVINGTLLAIEVDEFQHRRYSPFDEINRYNDIAMIHGGKMVFIRFNPDPYFDNEEKKHNPRLSSRIPVLLQEIKKHIVRIENGDNTDMLEIHRLYYDIPPEREIVLVD
jgi:hypothetical protein